MNLFTKNESNGNERLSFVLFVIEMALLGLIVLGQAAPARASTGFTQQQVDSIVGLLQAFGVDQSTIAIVEADLQPGMTTPSVIQATSTAATSTTIIILPVQTTQVQAPLSQSVQQPVLGPAPTCQFAARPFQRTGSNWQAAFAWNFTPLDAQGALTSNGSVVQLANNGTGGSAAYLSNLQKGILPSPYGGDVTGTPEGDGGVGEWAGAYSMSIFANEDVTLTVTTKDGQQTTCGASVVIPHN